jgi:autotransporter-associated beta strand protein
VNNKNISIGGRSNDATDRSFLRNVSGTNTWSGNLTISNSGGSYFITSLADTLILSGALTNAVAASSRSFELKGPGNHTISGSVANAAGTTGLTKSNGGTATVVGAKTYTGNTVITGGTLSLDTAYLADSSTVLISTGATLDLTHATQDTVFGLTLDGVVQPDGVYTSATPGGFISGTGSIKVAGNPYLAFVAVIAVVADRDPQDDPDADGISNGVEFVIGGNPAAVSNTDLLPTQTLVTADLGAGSTDYLKFTFRRTDVSAYLAPGVEYDTDLVGTWTPATNGVSGVVVQTADDAFATGVDRVDVFIPRSIAVDGKLFARLNVFVTP